MLSSLVFYHLSKEDKDDKDMEEMLSILNGLDEVIYYATHLKGEGNSLYK